MDMFSSTIIPTVNRSTLSRAVWSVLDQTLPFADFEVIVINDSGHPLPDADWRHSERVQVINTCRRERSVARNTGAAIAKGKYLHFLDDDDWLLPGALQAFYELDQGSDAAWLHGSYRTVDNDGNQISEFHPKLQGNVFALLIAGESIPFQVSLLNTRLFFAVGGFDADPGIIGVEDREVGRRMALYNTVASTTSVVAEIRIGEESSTTNWSSIAESDRLGRENALSLEGAGVRLADSATTHSLYGRICRAYLASALWNLGKNRFFTAVSRIVMGMRLGAFHVFSPSFYRGLRTKQTDEDRN